MRTKFWMLCGVISGLCLHDAAWAMEKKTAKKPPAAKKDTGKAPTTPEEVRKAENTTKPAEAEKKPEMPKSTTETPKPAEAEKPAPEPEVKPAAVSTMEMTELADFDRQPEAVKKIIRAALELTKKNLTYLFASHDPAKGGMDCSGAVYRVLLDEKIAGVPRQSDEMCAWVMKKAAFVRTEGVTKLDDDRFAKLQPGDLLFWSRKGGVEPGRALPITHVMMYLGRRAADQKPVIYGSSDGRSYAGQKRCGVSVFDFTLPKADDPKVEFYGYGSLPGLLAPVETRPALPTPAAKPPSKSGTSKKKKTGTK
ncbi:MAG: C40 family peptidase [Verrucomicrobiaceae bacterium]|nr:C40 family peptidase [Verrucomicrobiaceae bacterium]